MTREEHRRLENQRRWLIRRKRRRIKQLVRFTTFVFLLLFCIISVKLIISFLKSNRIETASDTGAVSSDFYKNRDKGGGGGGVQIADEDSKWNPELKELAKENPEIDQIIQNINEYPDRILELLVHNPETIRFVLDYPELKNIPVSFDQIDLSDSYAKGQIPLFLQWDSRWGYSPLGEEGIIALDGCGPTCLSMVMVGLTGDLSWNPLKMTEYCEREGYLAGSATSWELMTTGAQNLGLDARELILDENAVHKELSKGNPIICSMRPGDFTTTGHFIVLSGYRDGRILVNDPNSLVRSQEEWEFSKIKQQIKNLWVFSFS